MSFSGFNSESSDSFGSDWGGSLVPSPGGNPLVGMLRNLLPAAMVGVGGAVVNAVTAPFQQRRQQQKREDFEKIMLLAKYKADESLQTRQFGHDLEVQGNQHRHDLTMQGNQFGHDLTMQGNQFAHDRAMFQQNATLQVGLQENQFAHDRAMFQENKALQLGLQYLEHGQQNALQQRQFAHDGAMFQQQRELQLGLHYLSTQAAKEAAIEQYKLAQDSHEYKMARQLFPNLSLKGMGDKCTEAIDYGRATPLYVIPSSFKIADYYGLELFGDVPDWPQKFTKFLDQLNNQRLQLLRQFLGAYGAGDGQRSALLLWGVWSDHCADEAAHLNLHALGRGVVPMVASEVKVSGDQLVVLLSYVGIQESFCQQLLALPFGELLRGLAINEALRWEEKRQQLLAKQTRSEAEINARGGINEQNRQLWLEEQEDLAADRHLSSEDYPYQRGHLGGQAGTLIAVCELVGQLLAVDLHYLASAMDVQRGTLLTPALPRLLPQLFQTLIASGLTAILRQLVSTIVQAYVQALQKLQLQALIPDLVLEIAQELAGIENNELTSLLTEFSLKTLAGLRNLGVEVSLEGVRPLEAAIFKEDRDLVHRINGCLVALNHSERIEIDRAYFDRGVACLQRGDFAQAVQELSTKLELNATVEAYWQRARAYFGLQDWDNALVDLNQVAVLQHRLAEVFELRGDILRQQGEIQLAITAYNQAQEKGSPTAQRKREDLQRWWQDHERHPCGQQ
ncbi:MAG: hypothetical protein VKK80_03835 [Prochlorothrix sp.]|nr:hypothetical protein [Prochlorothrix sp.]